MSLYISVPLINYEAFVGIFKRTGGGMLFRISRRDVYLFFLPGLAEASRHSVIIHAPLTCSLRSVSFLIYWWFVHFP